MLDKQTHLQQNFRKDPQAVTKLKLDNEPVLREQFVFLNVEQIHCWNGNKRQYLTGMFGTGKTLLLQHKMLELIKHKNETCIFLYQQETVANLYHEFFECNHISTCDLKDFNQNTAGKPLFTFSIDSRQEPVMYQ